MLTKNLFLILSLLSIPFGIILVIIGYDKISDSNYALENISHGFLLSLAWTILGGSIFYQWLLWFTAHMASFVPTYKIEQFIFNCGLLFISATFLIGGLIFMSANPLYLNLCECEEGFYGPECLPCPQLNGQICNGQGTCDDLLLGTGTCDCNIGYEGSSCQECSLRFQKDENDQFCVCEKVWNGETCDQSAPGFNTTFYPYIFCTRGWLQTGFDSTPKNKYWSLPKIWPICGACEPFYGGHPNVKCTKCLGHNGTMPLSEENVCNGHGLCWDNENYDKKVFRCTGADCMPGIPEGGLINQCTPSWNICERDEDCPGTFNCAGKCLSIYSFPKGPTESWASEFDGKTCRLNDECNFLGNPYIGSILPEGWDTEGECGQFSCCAEAARGNYSCYNCRDDDIYDSLGNYVSRGPISWGRMAPACDDCPGWDNDLDVNGQTICNAKGTCNPLVDAEDNYVGMGCACTTDVETGQKWVGPFCECLKTAAPETTIINILNTPLTDIWINGTVNYTLPGLMADRNHYIDISKLLERVGDNDIFNGMKKQLDYTNTRTLDLKLYECDFPFDDGMYHITKFENNKYYLENMTSRHEDFVGVKDACDFRPCNYDDVCVADLNNIMKAHCEMNLTRRFLEYGELKIKKHELIIKILGEIPATTICATPSGLSSNIATLEADNVVRLNQDPSRTEENGGLHIVRMDELCPQYDFYGLTSTYTPAEIENSCSTTKTIAGNEMGSPQWDDYCSYNDNAITDESAVIFNLFTFAIEKVWNQTIMDYQDVNFGYLTFTPEVINVLLEDDTHVKDYGDGTNDYILKLMNMTIYDDMYNCMGANTMRDVKIGGDISAIDDEEWKKLFDDHIYPDKFTEFPYTCTITTKDLDYFRRNCTGMVLNIMFETEEILEINVGDEIIVNTVTTLEAMNRNQFMILYSERDDNVFITGYYDTFTEDFCLPPAYKSFTEESCNVEGNKVHGTRNTKNAKIACESTVSTYLNNEINDNCTYSPPFLVDLSTFDQGYICDNCQVPGTITKKEIPGEELCQKCVQGFYLEAIIPSDDHAYWSSGDWKAMTNPSKCYRCPGVSNVSGTGLAACNFKRGLGSCIYADAVNKRKDEPVYNPITDTMELETKQAYIDRLNNIGKCACTTQLDDEPRIAAMGGSCEEAPPNFYKYQIGRDWTIVSCPRTLPLGLSVCHADFPEYIWDHIGVDGTPRSSCTQSCGGKPVLMSMCSDDTINDTTYLVDTFQGDWEFLNQTLNENDVVNGSLMPDIFDRKGKCFCNRNNLAAEPTLYEYHYYRGFTGLCVKSKVKYL